MCKKEKIFDHFSTNKSIDSVDHNVFHFLIHQIVLTLLSHMLKITVALKNILKKFSDHLQTVFIIAIIIKILNSLPSCNWVSLTCENTNSNKAFKIL